MPEILTRLREQMSFLRQLHFTHSAKPIVETLAMLNGDVETKAILDDLRRQVDVGTLVSKGPFPSPPNVSNLTEKCAVGLHLMEQCQGSNIPNLVNKYHIRGASMRTIPDYAKALMDQFIYPLLEYVETRLVEKGSAITPEKATEFSRTKILTPEFGREFPATFEAIGKIAAYNATDHAADAWFTVGIQCREALNTFVGELRAKGLLGPSVDLKAGDTKGWLKRLVAGANPGDRFTDTLTELVASVWNHTQTILHRTSTTKEQALRVFMWSSLAIAEVYSLMQERK